MSYITISVLIFTVTCLCFGAFLGLIRGRNRSVLRFMLVLASAFVAFFSRDALVNTVMNFKVQGQTIKDMIVDFANNEIVLPSAIQNVLMTLIEIVFGIVVFYISFFVLKFVTWAIVFPICKCFVKGEVKKLFGQGALIGLAQGVVVAFIVCAPLNGLLLNANQIVNVQYQNKPLIEDIEWLGLESYADSKTSEVYSAVGNWFFEALSSKVDASGNKVSINDTCDIAQTVFEMADVMTSITNDLENIDMSASTPQEGVDTMKKLGDSLIKLDSSVDDLSEDAKTVVQEVLDDAKNMFADSNGNVPEEISGLIDNIKIEDLKLDSVGEAINGMATYIEKTSVDIDNDEPVTQDDVDSIVTGLADNAFIIDMLVEEIPTTFIEISESDKVLFETSINNSSLSEEYKDKLSQMLGLSDHEHITKGYSDEAGHWWSYTCGCIAPPNFALHNDGNGDGSCDTCGYQMNG